jgi:hypothetical protein
MMLGCVVFLVPVSSNDDWQPETRIPGCSTAPRPRLPPLVAAAHTEAA